MRQAFIVDTVRTPIGKYAGALSSIRPDDLAKTVLIALRERNASLPGEVIEDVILGCANQAGEDNRNVARMSLLLAGYPECVPGLPVNRLCGSGMSAALCAAQGIAAGEGDVYIAGGVESMSRAPFVMPKPEKAFAREPAMFDTTLGWRFVHPEMEKRFGVDSMGQTAENVAAEMQISREDQDAFAVWSQQKAARAISSGAFAKEIVPVEVVTGKNRLTVNADEYPRPDTTSDALAALKPVFRLDGKGSVTAGNASGINDGAAALLIVSEDALKKYGLKPRARILGGAVAGVAPRTMGLGPVPATEKLLARLRLRLEDLSVIELNEAFAAQALGCLRKLGIEDTDSRVNPLGGAIALGHPLGMSGARLIGTAVNQLEARGGRYALCTMCIGVGQGISCVVERVES